MALPTWKAKGTFTSSGNAISVPWPTSGTYAVGDFALLIVNSANEAIATPSGWTQISVSPSFVGTAAAIGGVRLAVFYAYATSTSMAAVSIADTGNYNVGQIHVFGGVHASQPIPAQMAQTEFNAATTTRYFPQIVVPVNECLIVNIAGLDNDAASTATMSAWTNGALSSLTERHDQTITTGVGGGIAIATGGLSTAGFSGATTATNIASAISYVSMTLALAPAARVIPVGTIDAAVTGTGYFSGGFDFDGNSSNANDKMTFNTETASTLAGTLYFAAGEACGASSLYSFGFNIGGRTSGSSWVEGANTIHYLSDTVGPYGCTVGGLVSDINFSASCFSGPSKAYIAYRNLSYTYDTYTTASISLGAFGSGSVTSDVKGYMAGNSSNAATIRALTYSDETVADLSATLGTGRKAPNGINSATVGYIAGGYNGSYLQTVDSLRFDTDTAAVQSASPHTGYVQAAVSSATSGYFTKNMSPDGSSAQGLSGFAFTSGTYRAVAAHLGGLANPSTCRSPTAASGQIASLDLTSATSTVGINRSTTETATADSTTDSTVQAGLNGESIATANAGSTTASALTSVVDRTDALTAADTPSTTATMAPAQSEAATSNASTGSALLVTRDTTAATTAAEAQDYLVNFGAIGSAAGAADSTQSNITDFVSAATEAASALAVQGKVVDYVGAASEAGSAATSHAASLNYATDNTAPATSSESQNALASTGLSAEEPASGTADATALATLPVADSEAGSATSAAESTFDAPVATTATANATDTPAATALLLDALTAAASAAASQDALQALLLAASEAVTALESSAATMVALSSGSEALSAQALVDASSLLVASVTVVTDTAESAAAQAAFTAAITVTAPATDTADASFQVTEYTVSAAEAVTAGSSATATATLIGIGDQAATASTLQSADGTNEAGVLEPTTASSVVSVLASHLLESSAAASASDAPAAGQTMTGQGNEAASATEQSTLGQGTSASAVEAATAVEQSAFALFQQAGHLAEALALDASVPLRVVTVTHPEDATAEDAADTTAVFFVYGSADATATDAPQSGSSIEAMVIEAVLAVAAASGKTPRELLNAVVNVFIRNTNTPAHVTEQVRAFHIKAVPETVRVSEHPTAVFVSRKP